MTTPTPPGPPRRITSPRRKPLALIGCGVVVAALLLMVVFNLDDPAQVAGVPPPSSDDVIELVPTQLTDAQRQSAGTSRAIPIGEISAETGWIESVDPATRKLAQRHRFERLEPNPEGYPEGWFRMHQPQAEMYLSDDRLVTLSGDVAVARAPHHALEHGTLTGHVLIRVFEPDAEGRIDIENDVPVLMVTTAEAEFDNRHGEVTCPGRILIETPDAEIPGERMQLRINDVRQVAQLRIESIDYIHVKAAAPVPLPEEGGEAGAEARAGARAREEVVAAAPTEKPKRDERRPRPAQSAAPEDVEHYLLTMHDNVAVRRNTGEGLQIIRGDDLTVVFSERSEGVGERVASRSGRVIGSPAPPDASWPGLLASLVSAQPASPIDPGPGETVITCDGPVTIDPLPDDAPRLESPQDMLLTLHGDPVTLEDTLEEATASCGQLRYHNLAQQIELIAVDPHPLVVATPQFSGRGQRFWLSKVTGLGGFEGDGLLAVAEPDDPLTELRITWAEGVDLAFTEPEDGGSSQLREATFNGDVKVRHEEIHMDAGRMTVGFAPGTDDQPTPDSILAEGNVFVKSVGDSGEMKAGHLDLSLTRTDDGRTVPTHLFAKDDVEAVESDQVMWTDELDVTFRLVSGADPEKPEATTAEVETVTATGDVQVLLEDGSRAFGDRLEADAVKETGLLTGRDVVIVRDKALFDHGQNVRLRMNRGEGRARWEGPGQMRMFRAPIPLERRGRIERPVIDSEVNRPEVRARWNRAMAYDNEVNGGAGAVTLEGGVNAITRTTPIDRNTMTGDSLRLEFVLDETATAAERPDDEFDMFADENRGRRTIASLVAKGQARLESRTWLTPEQVEKPRVFFVAGEHVAFDDRTSEALVEGAGTMLLRDEHPDADDDAGPIRRADRGPNVPFNGKGTTSFEFAERLRMTPQPTGDTKITMSGDVRVLHKALDGSVGTMTGGALDTWVKRRRRTDDAGVPAPDAAGFGGSMELQRIRARRAVYVSTPTRKIDCDEIDYDLVTGLARLSGRVSVLTGQSRVPFTARSVMWDVIKDSIRVEGARGSGGR